jgi:hypothetical protein
VCVTHKLFLTTPQALLFLTVVKAGLGLSVTRGSGFLLRRLELREGAATHEVRNARAVRDPQRFRATQRMRKQPGTREEVPATRQWRGCFFTRIGCVR